MTARVINDPSALGWEYDPDTGRWAWGGGSSSNGGGGNGTFPEAPVDGEQYARQDAGWAVIVHPDVSGGTVTTADVKLTNPTLRSPIGLDTQEDANQYFYGELGKLIDEDGNVIGGGGGGIPDAPTDGAIYGRKNADWVVVPTSGGGDGPDMSNYYTATQCDAKFHPKGTYDNYVSWNVKVNNGTAMAVGKNATLDFQGGGNTSITRSNGVISISSTGITSETDPTVPSWVKAISQNDINKWNNPPAGGGDDPNAVKLTGDQTINGVKTFAGGSTFFKNLFLSGVSAGGVGISGGARIEFSSGATTVYSGANTLQVNAGGTTISGNLIATGALQGTDCIATSDERLKDNITTARLGFIDHLKGREWDWLETREKGSGVVAQELEKVLPHLVHEDDEGMKSVSYNGLVAYLIEEVKALKAEVELLRNG